MSAYQIIDHEYDVVTGARLGHAVQGLARLVIEAPPHVGPLKIHGPICGSAVHEAGFVSARFEGRFKRRGVEFVMDRVARAGVRKLKFKMWLRWKARAGTPERNARRGILPEFAPRIGDDDGLRFIRHGRSGPQ